MLRTTARLGARLLVALAPVLAPAASAGDFNGDGYADLVLGVPTEGVAAIDATGAVHVLFGSAAGPATAGAEYITQADIPDGSANGSGDHVGRNFAVGDFDLDSRGDLAIGAAVAAATAGLAGGAVFVVYSREDGFDDDLIPDLAIGVPGDTAGSSADSGTFMILFGEFQVGLGSADSQLIHQDSGSVPGTAEIGDHFGDACAVGDFDGDSVVDLAVGAPGKEVNGESSAGSAFVLFGVNSSGIGTATGLSFDQESPGIAGTAASFESFGIALGS